MEGIVVEPHVVHALYALGVVKPLGQRERIGSLNVVAGTESLQSKSLEISHLRCHIGSEVEQHLTLYPLVEIGERSIVDDKPSERRRSTAEILCRRDDFDVGSQVVNREHREWNRSGIGHEWDIILARHGSKLTDVSHLHLRICYYLEEYTARIGIDIFLDVSDIGKIAESRLDSKALQRVS